MVVIQIEAATRYERVFLTQKMFPTKQTTTTAVSSYIRDILRLLF